MHVQQSSVEWCSSLWLKVAQEVDPGLKRTVIVASKFDNRLKEFAERWEVSLVQFIYSDGSCNRAGEVFERELSVALQRRRCIISTRAKKGLNPLAKTGLQEQQIGIVSHTVV